MSKRLLEFTCKTLKAPKENMLVFKRQIEGLKIVDGNFQTIE